MSGLAQRRVEEAIDALVDGRFELEERERIRAAAGFAAEAHRAQVRASGEPFVLHPLAVARILVEENLSCTTVVAGVLHDVVEDTEVGIDEIAERFGEEVAQLVDGVTKITRLSPRRSAKKSRAESYRKLILAAADDARVIVVKLADRLHNLRTISHLDPARRRRIAAETLEVYAPFAHRLGMSRIKGELEDRSLAILDPQGYEEAGLIQREATRSGEATLQMMRERLHEELAAAGIAASSIKSRIKSRASILEKLNRGGGGRAIEDVVGLRVIVETVDECYRALGVVHSLWPPRAGAFDDYIAVPKANLYRSLHTTVNVEGRLVEVQIRTREMDEVAERGIAAHWIYKDATLQGGGPTSTKHFLTRIAENQEEAGELEEAFAAMKADFFAEEIYVFTPRGEVKVLPEGSCAIDFAYAIHSEIGDHVCGCRVDGRLYPITQPLRAGQSVEVLTSPNAHPSLDWLPHLKTARARQRTRAFHSAELRRERLERGRRVLEEELRRVGVEPTADERLEAELSRVGHSLKSASLEAARDRSHARSIARRLAAQEHAGEDGSRRPPPRRSAAEAGIRIAGVGDVPVRFARCCCPEPGEPILGYVRHGHGLTVHRRSCASVASLRQGEEARLVEVSWSDEEPRSYGIELELRLIDRPRFLVQMAEAVHDAGAELVDLQLHSGYGVVKGRLRVEVTSAAQAERLRSALASLEGVLNVTRAGSGQAG